MSIDIQAAIRRLLGFRSLKKVTFYLTIDVPWTVFQEISPNVTALSLDGVWFSPEVEPEETDDEWSNDDIVPPGDSTQAPLLKENAIDRLRIEALSIGHGTLGVDPTIIVAHDSVCPLNITRLRTFWLHAYSDSCWIRYQEFISQVSRSLETLGINFSLFDDNKNVALPSLDCSQLDNLKQLHTQTSYRGVSLALQSAFIRCVIGIEECVVGAGGRKGSGMG